MRLRFVGLVVLTAVALAGCASPDATGSAGAPSASSSSSPAPAPSSSSSPASAGSSLTPSGGPVPSTSVTLATMTITGEVKDGVEPGCVLLTTPNKTYLLIGGDRSAMTSGKRLTVVGRPQPDM